MESIFNVELKNDLYKEEKNSHHKTNFGPLLIEVVLIVLAVLLGLAANEWRVARAEKAQARNALRYIKNELQSNKEQVDNFIPIHISIRDSLKALGTHLQKRNANITLTDLGKAMPSGFDVPLIEKTGWQLANQTDAINHIDYKLAADLSKLYYLQDFYQAKLDKVAESIYIASNLNLTDMSGFTFAFTVLASDIVIQEKRLSKLYARMIKNLENNEN